MVVKAVLFDLWGTLILDSEERAEPRRQWRAARVAEVLSDHGAAVSPEVVDAALGSASVALSDLHDRGVDLDGRGRVTLFLEQLDASLARLVPETAHAGLEEAICRMHPIFRPEPADGACDVLRQVRALGLRTALVSNAGFTTADSLRQMLDWYALAPLLDLLVFSDELELAKPDRRVFERAAAGLAASTEECVFVGDSPHNDIFGARSVGMFAVQVGDRRQSSPSARLTAGAVTANPHARIDALPELLPLLAALP